MTDVPVRFTIEPLIEGTAEDPRIAELEAQVAELHSLLDISMQEIEQLEASQKVYSIGDPVMVNAGINTGVAGFVRQHYELVLVDGETKSRTYSHASISPLGG